MAGALLRSRALATRLSLRSLGQHAASAWRPAALRAAAPGRAACTPLPRARQLVVVAAAARQVRRRAAAGLWHAALPAG
jgi:hypothetical protein